MGRIVHGILEHRGFVLLLLGLAVAFCQLYFWIGRHLLLEGVLYGNNLLFGLDIQRSAEDMALEGSRRSNVHPLFVLYAKPATALFTRVAPGQETANRPGEEHDHHGRN